MGLAEIGLEDQLAFRASDDVARALVSVGRTEDLKFSPDGRRLAITGFAKDKFLLIDVEMKPSAGGRSIALRHAVEITSPDLHEPHGFAFLDEETLVVANRLGKVHVFRLPAKDSPEATVALVPEPIVGEDKFRELLQWPGSVALIARGGSRYDMLVCNNYIHQVTRHRLVRKKRIRVKRNEVLLEQDLNVPDGVAVDGTGRWIAVSNHTSGSVLMYENSKSLGRRSHPLGELRGAGYPHGVRFTRDERSILVADAGAPFVRLYHSPGRDWRGPRDPVAELRVLNEAAFQRGRTNPEEGGPKGIDFDAGMNVLVVTCEEAPLAFFDLRAILKRSGVPSGSIWGSVAGVALSAWRSVRA